MFPIMPLNITLYQAASFYRLAHIRPRSLRERRRAQFPFLKGYFTKTTPPRLREESKHWKWAKNPVFLSSFIFLTPLFLIPFPAFFSLSVLISLLPSIPAGGVTVNAMWRMKDWGVIVCAWGGLFLCSGRHQRGRLWSDGARQAAHTHIKRQIFWSLQLRLWRAWQLLVFQTLTVGQAGGSFSALRQTALIRRRLERAALNHSASKLDLM